MLRWAVFLYAGHGAYLADERSVTVVYSQVIDNANLMILIVPVTEKKPVVLDRRIEALLLQTLVHILALVQESPNLNCFQLFLYHIKMRWFFILYKKNESCVSSHIVRGEQDDDTIMPESALK